MHGSICEERKQKEKKKKKKPLWCNMEDYSVACEIMKMVSAKRKLCEVNHFSSLIFKMAWLGYISLYVRLVRGHSGPVPSNPLLNQN